MMPIATTTETLFLRVIAILAHPGIPNFYITD